MVEKTTKYLSGSIPQTYQILENTNDKEEIIYIKAFPAPVAMPRR
jgi:hypothetical protein